MKIDGKELMYANNAVDVYVFNITDKHIKGATRRSLKNCPVARYFKMDGYSGQPVLDVWATKSRLLLKVGDENNYKWWRLSLPSHLLREMLAFDKGGKFEIGEYRLGVIHKKEQTY